jgi:hypothetical protein
MLEELRPRCADQEQRHLIGDVREVLEESEHRLVGPMQVLEHQYRWALLGDQLEEPPPGGEQFLPFG